jgi:sterol desaturase/sphingolipid hydroxylase (fatty acid hydroxylase superfamily)
METLNNLFPLLVIGSLSLFMTLEVWMPYFKHSAGRRRQRWRNVGMMSIGFFLNAVLGGVFVAPIVLSEANNTGLLHRVLGQSALAIVIGMFLIDLLLYASHVTFHKVSIMWRFHRVHHADVELDATSGLRLHPFELITLLSAQMLVLPVLGVSVASTVIYNSIALPWFLLNHSNMKFPTWFERYGSLMMSTPDWHRVHHSSYQPQTDSHYGCVLSVWDRLFGTGGRANVETIQFGLDKFRDPGEQTVWRLLKLPFAGS